MADNERLRLIRKELRLTQNEFSEKLGIQQGSLSDIERGKYKVSGDIKLKLKELFNVNIGWLESGIGEMFTLPDAVLIANPNIRNVPIISQYAYAGYLSGYGDAEYIESLPTVPFIFSHEAKGNYVCFEVKGDSMNNNTNSSLLEGDRLLCREIVPHLWVNSRLHISKWYFVIVHKEEGVIVKKIAEHSVEDKKIKVHSLNPEYEDKIIDLNDVAQLFNVVEVSRSLRL